MFNSAQRAANKVAKMIAKERYPAAIALLVREGASPEGVFNHKRWGKVTTLSLAVLAGRPDMVKLLLEKGADANRRNENGYTALYYLYGSKNDSNADLSAIVSHLLHAGANIDGHDSDGAPLLASVYYDSYKAAQKATLVLLNHGASTAIKHKDSQASALHRAAMCYHPHSVVIEALVAAGCPVNDKNKRGLTALHFASEYGVSENIRALLDAGADPDARDNDLRTPADLARNPGVASFITGYEERRKKGSLPAAGWVKVSQDEIALISEKTAIGYQLTEIFNFARGEVTLISRNLASGAEGVTVRAFNQLADDAPLRTAQERLHALGGAAPAAGKSVSLIERKPGNGLL